MRLEESVTNRIMDSERSVASEEARRVNIEYIGYYNTERRHSSLGYVPPAQFECRWRDGVEKSAQAPLQ